MLEAVAEPDAVEKLPGMPEIGAPGGEAHAEHDVLDHRVSLKQVERLEDVAELRGPEPVARRLGERGHVGAVDQDAPRVRGEDPCNEVQERRLSAPAFAPKRAFRAPGKREARYAHNVDLHPIGSGE